MTEGGRLGRVTAVRCPPLGLSESASLGRRAGSAPMTTIDTGTDKLLVDVEDGIALVTFNQPEKHNALSVRHPDGPSADDSGACRRIPRFGWSF